LNGVRIQAFEGGRVLLKRLADAGFGGGVCGGGTLRGEAGPTEGVLVAQKRYGQLWASSVEVPLTVTVASL
jgi:hypothetical protein